MKKFNWTPIINDEIKWLGIDFDDVVCSNNGLPNFEPNEPFPGAVEALQKLDAAGYKIIIYTARHWADYKNLEEYCLYYKIPARRIICGKPLFKWIVDDKNIEFDGDWDYVLRKLGV